MKIFKQETIEKFTLINIYRKYVPFKKKMSIIKDKRSNEEKNYDIAEA
jgi:hypothetical protein